MSDKSEKIIKTHEILEPHETDESARTIAAARLWATGDEENMRAAKKIWEHLKTTESVINSLKDFIRRQKIG